MSEEFSGRVDILDGQNRKVFQFDSSFAVLDIGVAGNEGDLRIIGNDGNVMIHLDGGTGDITLAGEGCAEDFEVGSRGGAEPGSS
jgi:hypothetical protein